MASVTLYKQTGEQAGTLELEASLFDVKANPALVHEAVVAQSVNSRDNIAHTKDRSEVAGTGKKPWKQKGTGRARHGSRRSPIWVGGGITFGPRNERVYSLKMNKRAKKKAFAMVLSDKVAHDKLVALETLEIKEGKTKELAQVLQALPVSGRKTLIVLTSEDIPAARAARNIPKVETISSKSLNIVDLLAYDYVLASKKAIEEVTETYKR